MTIPHDSPAVDLVYREFPLSQELDLAPQVYIYIYIYMHLPSNSDRIPYYPSHPYCSHRIILPHDKHREYPRCTMTEKHLQGPYAVHLALPLHHPIVLLTDVSGFCAAFVRAVVRRGHDDCDRDVIVGMNRRRRFVEDTTRRAHHSRALWEQAAVSGLR